METSVRKKPVTTEIDRLIKILVKNLQTDPQAPVREYISNACDATRGTVNPKIRVWGDRKRLFIEDNGCGMTEEVITTAFTRIAGHRNHFDQDLTIGMFGIGVLSAFIAAEKLEVHTRSRQEPHGWRLVWNRFETDFELEPMTIEREGTLAILHLDEDTQDIALDKDLETYVKRTFALLDTPIYVGRDEYRTPGNVHYQLINQLRKENEEPKLLYPDTVKDIFSKFSHEATNGLLMGYHARLPDKTDIFLAIPLHTISTLHQKHDVAFFSKGVYVHGGITNFFPENLSFLIGLIDSPHFKLQITKEEIFVRDDYFIYIRKLIEEHALRFLELLKTNPGVLTTVLDVHRDKILAYVSANPAGLWLFRDFGRFLTSNGHRTWYEILRFASHEQKNRILYYTNQPMEIWQDFSNTTTFEGFITIYAMGMELSILEKLARQEAVELRNIGDRSKNQPTEEVPEPFRKLAARMRKELVRRNCGVGFVNLPGANQYPAMFETRTVAGKSLISQSDEHGMAVDSLLLNIAHPLIRRLAGKIDLTDKEAQLSAETLYEIAVLHSPFTNMWFSCREDVVQNLVAGLEQRVRVRSRRQDSTGADCFVAMPYAAEFQPIWECFHQILSASPYRWKVIRADQNIQDNMLIASLQGLIRGSQRYLADISGLNPNVLLEVGMMLECDPDLLLMICDDLTFKGLPVDLSGKLVLVYPHALRREPDKLCTFFEEKLKAYVMWINMAGKL